MGNCCRKGSNDDDPVELAVVDNDLVKCKMGAFGDKIKVTQAQGKAAFSVG